MTPSVGTLAAGRPPSLGASGGGGAEPPSVASSPPAPGSETTVTVDFEGSALGPFRALLNVTFPVAAGPAPDPRILDVSAQVVAGSLSLVHAGGKGPVGETLDFGARVYGQSKTVEAMLVNDGPQAISYQLAAEVDRSTMEELDRAEGGGGEGSPPEPPSSSSSSSPADGGDGGGEDDDDPLHRTITVSPTEGIIEPFSQLPVAFTFSPSLSTKQRGFASGAAGPEAAPSRNFAARISIEGAEVSKPLSLLCTGKAVRPHVSLSSRVLRFGSCPVHERRDILLTLKNTSPLPLPFAFSTLPNFQAHPAKGTLKPLQSQPCVVSFAPGQMGERKAVMDLVVAGGMATFPIRCTGQATAAAPGAKKTFKGGPAMAPDDFQPTFNFVKSEGAAEKKQRAGANKFVRPQPWETFDLAQSSAWDESKMNSSSPQAAAETASINANNKDTFSVQKMAENAEHRKKYSSYLTQAREERGARTEKKRRTAFERKFNTLSLSDPDSVDIGLDRDGDEPIPALPVATEALWLQRPLDGSSPSGGGSRMPVDENRLTAKKFKAAPTTQAEVRDCGAELTSQDLLKIAASSKVLDFGEVVVNSVTAKNFAVTNELTRTVLVALGAGGKLDPEVEASSPGAQVVPAGSTAGFDITFSSASEGRVKKTVQYKVNGRHLFKFTVLATVVPVSLLLSTPSLSMSFSEQSLDSSLTETITLENPGNAAANFTWTSRRAFVAKPERGTVPPKGTLECTVTWTPSPAYKNEEVLALHVEGGGEVELPVRGVLQEARCKFKQTSLDCGVLAVGIEAARTVELKNTGKSPAVVFVDGFPEGTGITCLPEKARIPPGQSQEFVLTFKPPSPLVYRDVGMTALVRGGKMVRLPIACSSVVPKVLFEQEGFDFESVVIGNAIRMPVSLTNEGTIPAALQLDLAKHPDFSFEEARRASKGKVADDFGMEAAAAAADISSLDAVFSGRGGGGGGGGGGEAAHKWKVTVAAGRTFTLDLVYRPTTVGDHDFPLPLMFQGIPADGSLKRQVTAAGVKPRLVMSETTCDFEDRVVQRDQGRRVPYTKELTFANDTGEGISWELDDSSLRPVSTAGGGANGGSVTAVALWYVSPKRGDLTPGEKVTVRVTFSPQEDADYEAELPLFLADQADRSRPYLNLSMRGCGVYPRITFSAEEVLLPAVPLNVVSRAKIWIVNDGYDSLDVTHKLALNCQIPLGVEFPEGKTVGMAGQPSRVPVIISYSSSKPVSLNTKIDFFDADGSCYSINVIGAADNSVFTNFPFLASYSDGYKYFAMDGAPVCLYDKKRVLAMQQIESKKKEDDRAAKRKEAEREAAELAAAAASSSKQLPGKEKEKEKKKKKAGPPSSSPLTMGALLSQTEADGLAGIDTEKEGFRLSEDDVTSLKLWLNANVMVAPIVSFPGDFLDTNGKTGIDAIEMMCGKKIPGKFGGVKKLSANKTEHWGQLQGQYKELMLFMKQHGGLLAGVRPEDLLQRSHYLAAKEDEAASGPTRVTAAQLKSRKAKWEASHAATNREAWSSLMFQAIRVFVLGRVTPKGMSALPGVLMPATTKGKEGKDGAGKKGIDAELEGSNLYSLGESCLLKWVGYHVNQNMTSTVMKKRVTNFEADFADGAVLCHLLASHLPQLCQEGGPLKGFSGCSESAALEKPEVRQANMKRVLDVFKMCRMDFGASLENLLQPSARLMAMFVLHLYQALPQLIPKTSIDFQCTLNDTMKKSIALTNPSGKGVSYQVTLEGCQDFAIEAETVALDPKSVTQFLVSLTPRFSRPQEARLTFWAQKDGGPMAGNLVFLLKSSVTKLKAVKTYTVAAKNFELTTVAVTVKNPYDKVCTFVTEIQQSLTTQFTGVPGATFPLPETIFGPALARQKGKTKRAGTPGTALGGTGTGTGTGKVGGGEPDKAAEAEALAVEISDKQNCLALLGRPLYVPETTKIKLKPGEETVVTVTVLCFVPGVYTGYLILLDEAVGQFACEIEVSCGLPPLSAELSFDHAAEDENSMEAEKVLKVPARNAMVERAATTLLDRMSSAVRTRCRNLLLGFLAPTGSVENGGRVRYRCTIDSPYFQGSPDVIMKGNEYVKVEGGGGGGGGAAATGGAANGAANGGGQQLSKVVSLEDPPSDGVRPASNCLGLSFYPKEAGTYPCTVTLMPTTGEADMRTYSITATVTTQPKETTLDFRAPARQSIVQEIPVSNNGPEDWTMSCAVGGSKCFSGSNSFKVPANSTASYSLSFKPAWICEETGTLTMKNAKLGSNFVFNLNGVGEEPLSEGNIEIKLGARESHEQTLELPALGARTYSIETDLPYVTGPATLTTTGTGGGDDGAGGDNTGGDNTYTMSVNPQTGGNFAGQITFTDEASGMYVWYTVDLLVNAPAAEANITITAECRKASVATISLSNPTADPITFDVALDGDGVLGDKTFVLEPNGSSAYELFYSPLLAKKHTGTVAFTNEAAGEFWYQLNLTATPAPHVDLEAMSCPVGGKVKQRVFIQNPLGKEVKLGSSCHNSRNYSVSPSGPKLPPYGEGWFDVCYTPSSLGEEESSRIDLAHPELGNFIYFVCGSGALPGLMDEEHCPVSIVNDQTTYPFKFRNPFNAALTVDLILETDDGKEGGVNGGVESPSADDSFASSKVEVPVAHETFRLLPKKTREIVMAPHTSIQIPISFSPDSIEEKGARLVVRGEIGMKRDLVWIYSIRGLAEAPMGKAIIMSGPAKKAIKMDVNLGLYGLVQDGLAPEGEEFNFAVEYPACTEEQEYLLKEWLAIVGTNLKLDSPDGSLGFRLDFQPLRPFVAGAELVVTRASTGGRWKFPIRVDVEDAEPEQEPIMIEAAIKTIKKVVFRLNNKTKDPAKFQAFFTVDSAKTLSVEPSGGLLQPHGEDGTEFFIAYAPDEYGKAEKGRLIIQTVEMQWIYDIHTRQPGFHIPRNISSKIDNRLDSHLEQSLGTSRLAGKNVIAENMKSGKLMVGRLRNEKANIINKQIKDLPSVG